MKFKVIYYGTKGIFYKPILFYLFSLICFHCPDYLLFVFIIILSSAFLLFTLWLFLCCIVCWCDVQWNYIYIILKKELVTWTSTANESSKHGIMADVNNYLIHYCLIQQNNVRIYRQVISEELQMTLYIMSVIKPIKRKYILKIILFYSFQNL